MPKKPTAEARETAARCEDAYSADRYANWAGVAQALLDMGLKPIEAEAIMRSKYTRWAADESSARYGKTPAKAIVDFRAKYPAYFDTKTVRQMVAETF